MADTVADSTPDAVATPSTARSTPKPNKPAWRALVAPYQKPNTRLAVRQLLTSIPPFLVLWYATYRSLEVGYWLTLLLAVPTAGLVIRIFIIQHDCGHGAFLGSRRWNDAIGVFCSAITLTPYEAWRHNHAVHHAHAGDLDHRGTGDILTLTIDEYRNRSFWGKLGYRIYRNPVVLLGLGAVANFVILQRIPAQAKRGKQYWSVHLTTLIIVAIAALVIWLVGWKAFLLVQIPITAISAGIGVFMFYVQHQFEDVYWAREDTWDYATAALKGSSYFKLPPVLQWFTGNIGFHHIHHLSPRIPNYLLEKCHEENPVFQQVVVLTLWTSFKTIFLSLWDEEQGRLISFRQLRSFRPQSRLSESA